MVTEDKNALMEQEDNEKRFEEYMRLNGIFKQEDGTYKASKEAMWLLDGLPKAEDYDDDAEVEVEDDLTEPDPRKTLDGEEEELDIMVAYFKECQKAIEYRNMGNVNYIPEENFKRQVAKIPGELAYLKFECETKLVLDTIKKWNEKVGYYKEVALPAFNEQYKNELFLINKSEEIKKKREEGENFVEEDIKKRKYLKKRRRWLAIKEYKDMAIENCSNYGELQATRNYIWKHNRDVTLKKLIGDYDLVDNPTGWQDCVKKFVLKENEVQINDKVYQFNKDKDLLTKSRLKVFYDNGGGERGNPTLDIQSFDFCKDYCMNELYFLLEDGICFELKGTADGGLLFTQININPLPSDYEETGYYGENHFVRLKRLDGKDYKVIREE